MTQESIAILEKHRHHYDFFIKTESFNNLDGNTRNEIYDVIRKEFASNYICCLHCREDVTRMIIYAYKQFNKYLNQ